MKVKKEKKQKKAKKSGFLKNLRSEMKNVKWPSFKDIIKYTLATVVLVVIIALFFQGLNVLVSLVKGLFN